MDFLKNNKKSIFLGGFFSISLAFLWLSKKEQQNLTKATKNLFQNFIFFSLKKDTK